VAGNNRAWLILYPFYLLYKAGYALLKINYNTVFRIGSEFVKELNI
jgi:hypothetical protein